MINYITRDAHGITINGNQFVAIGIRQYINTLCLKHGSTMNGRIASARYLLKRHALVPIFVKEDLCLVSTTSLRDPDVVYLNSHQIAFVKGHLDGSIIHFFDGSTRIIPVTKNVIQKQQSLANQLLALYSN
jgi:hypothetical protein